MLARFIVLAMGGSAISTMTLWSSLGWHAILVAPLAASGITGLAAIVAAAHETVLESGTFESVPSRRVRVAPID